MIHKLWGMIHVPALPGSYKQTMSMEDIVKFCMIDAKHLVENGINHLCIENFWDVPFPKNSSQPHIVSALSIIADRIIERYSEVVLGINVLRNDALSALGIATITKSKFIRVNVLTHARVTDQGIIEGLAYNLLQYKSLLGSNVEIWADIDVKHSAPIADFALEDIIKDSLERGGANKLIFSGKRTGSPADITIIQKLIENKILLKEQVVIGSGITAENIIEYLNVAENFIVGSSLKLDGKLKNNIDPNKVKALVSRL